MNAKLNEGQQKAHDEIIAAHSKKTTNKYLLTGPAGTGKTYLMQSIARSMLDMQKRLAAIAPTHKAIQVLSNKMTEASLNVPCMTEHALLGLRPAPSDTEKTILKRIGKSRAGAYDAIVCDEVSMNGRQMQDALDEDLRFHFTLYTGDPAQLSPVGEEKAPIFDMIGGEFHYHLSEIVRQEAGNPILLAAKCLREQQGREVDWSWVKTEERGSQGVYCAGLDVNDWMKDAFLSSDFKENNDAFRVIAYTNYRVKELNARIRYWLYGETETPFVVGERVMCRNPILDQHGKPAFQTNEEAIISDIQLGTRKFMFEKRVASPGQQEIPEWSYELPVWEISLSRNEPGTYYDEFERRTVQVFDDVVAYFPVKEAEHQSLIRRLATEAKANKARWRDHFIFKDQIADLRSVYALTAHTSQGSTFLNGFLDIQDAAKLQNRNPLEMQRMLYVMVTRFRNAVVLMDR